ncbi:autotransporter outer membrane beta-barrel domain-containing protein [Pseudoruegeria sp. SHC-113]|uniref:autotransporter outer membrane beta-barrel domain-containing protein n=1 Tax=Pseudoruegeria sp. SHC-113 TaxID=2855439 RepID=UPI0021BAB146|nr:autotransporter outer membrane beta-barrel domain-containing protein [Pseudoruegeria sp. SHC-113]MCT8161051.1 autotransporter outer membrane beta-barrel domain-containing protein [Pseudoruegeria sp. SHC-113]
MGGEHAFLPGFVTALDADLAAAGVVNRNYGLAGYGGGGSGNFGRTLPVGGGDLGSAADFGTATGNLVLSGGFEDGYAAIDYVLNNFTLTSGATTTFVLVTDEDRDIGDAALTFGSISADLNAANVTLVSIVNADIVDVNGDFALGSSDTDAFVQDGSSFVVTPLGSTSGVGTTDADYIQLAFSTPNGCVGDLDFLRAGGDSAIAFAEAVSSCVFVSAVGTGGLTLPLNQYRDTASVISRTHHSATRRMALASDTYYPTGGSIDVSSNAQVFDDMLGIEGFRGYAQVTGYSGDYDGFGASAELDYSGGGILIGVDHTRSLSSDVLGEGEVSMLRYGASVAYNNFNTDLSGTDSSLDTRNYMLELYAVYENRAGFYGIADLQFGTYDYENTRVAGGSSFVGKTDGKSYQAEIEVGRRMPKRMTNPGVHDGSYQLIPFAALGWEKYEVDGYVESNGGATVASFDEDSGYGRLGLRVATSRTRGDNLYFGSVEIAGARSFSNTFQTVPLNGGASFATIENIDQNRLEVVIEGGVVLNSTSHLFANYEGRFSGNSDQHALTAGLRMRF